MHCLICFFTFGIFKSSTTVRQSMVDLTSSNTKIDIYLFLLSYSFVDKFQEYVFLKLCAKTTECCFPKYKLGNLFVDKCEVSVKSVALRI